jgi:hypothetical protein
MYDKTKQKLFTETACIALILQGVHAELAEKGVNNDYINKRLKAVATRLSNINAIVVSN